MENGFVVYSGWALLCMIPALSFGRTPLGVETGLCVVQCVLRLSTFVCLVVISSELIPLGLQVCVARR